MRTFTVIVILSIATCSFAQSKWSLRQCIEYAMKNNIQIKQKIIDNQTSQIQLNTAKMSRLPDLNAAINQNFNFGRSASRTNVIEDQNSSNSGINFSTSIPLFTGFRISNQIESYKWSVKATLADLDKIKEDVALNITSAYLQVIFNRELGKVATEQAKLSNEQVERTSSLVAAGKLPQSELYETQATKAKDESEVTRLNSQLQLSLLDLAQLIELEKVAGFDVEDPQADSMLINGMGNISDVENTFNSAVTNRPALKAAEYRLEEGKRNIKLAKSDYFPTLTFGANYTNGYYYTYNLPTGVYNPDFNSQVKNNGQSAIGLTLNIPIFNRFATRNRVKTAEMESEIRKINYENARKTLLKDIQQAYYNAVAARDKYRSAQKSVEASEMAFSFAKNKFEAGKATSYEFNETTNRRVKSLSEQVQAKYEFIFRCKILDFYNGKLIE